MHRLIGQRGTFTSDVAKTLGGNTLARLITFAAIPFVTRIYTPDAVGVWAVLTTLAAFLAPIATLRYDVAIVIAPTRRMASALVVLTGACTLALVLALTAAVALAPSWLWEDVSGLQKSHLALIAILPILLATLSLQVILQAWLTRQRQFGILSLTLLIQAVITTALTLLLPFVAGASAVVVIASNFAGLLASVAFAAWGCRVNVLAGDGGHRLRAIYHGARRYRVYPAYFVPYSFSAGLTERILQVILASTFSLSVLGVFFVARQLTVGPVTMLSATLSQVLFAHSARQDDPIAMKQRVCRILRLLIDAGVPVLVFALIWLKPIMAVALGDKWLYLGDFIWWSLLPAAVMMLSGFLNRVFDVRGRQGMSATYQIAANTCLTLVILLMARTGLTPIQFVAWLSVATALYHIGWLVMIFRVLEIDRRETGALLFRAAKVGAISGGAQFALATVIPAFVGPLAGLIVLAATLAPVSIVQFKRTAGALL